VADAQQEEEKCVTPGADGCEHSTLSSEFNFGDDMFLDDKGVREKKSRS